jgi:hypothetical protein
MCPPDYDAYKNNSPYIIRVGMEPRPPQNIDSSPVAGFHVVPIIII